MSTSVFAFIIVLGVLIFFHELGHFLVARLFGVGVEKFSLGFGPRIIGKRIGITDYRISAVPLGGYVKMVGEEPNARIDPADRPLSFTHKHVLKRILIVAAGPIFNILLAVIIFYGIFQMSGIDILKPTVGKVQAGMPAQKMGLMKGDEIVAINGVAVESWEEMAGIIAASKGDPLELSVHREGLTKIVNITPMLDTIPNIFGEDTRRYVIGIRPLGDFYHKELNPFQALSESFIRTYDIAALTIISIVKLIRGTLSIKTLGGPIMIAELAGQQAKLGVSNLVFFIALISINLAILNFLPIPVLDGGHLLFFFIELVMRRPLSVRVREIAQQAGLFVLILLMILVFYNDITRHFISQ
ncbi:MAG: RIP metalloprotease RseP [Deltaproteobacteria bacterium]|nr:MAG: RIP metalloprotease RseP [Deltaproteobacteria bacterium]